MNKRALPSIRSETLRVPVLQTLVPALIFSGVFVVSSALAQDSEPAAVPEPALGTIPQPASQASPQSAPQVPPQSAPLSTGATSISPILTGAKQKPASFYGLTSAQIEARFGQPDQKVVKAGGSEEWSYGKSVLFFSSGKVNAWSDGGELTDREHEANLKKAPVDHDDALSGDWPNPWTPGKKAQDLDFLGQ